MLSLLLDKIILEQLDPPSARSLWGPWDYFLMSLTSDVVIVMEQLLLIIDPFLC